MKEQTKNNIQFFAIWVALFLVVGLLFKGCLVLSDHEREEFRENCSNNGFRTTILDQELVCLNDNDVVVSRLGGEY